MVTICVMPKSTTHARRGEAKRAGMFLRNFHIEGHCGRASESRAPFAENGWDKERQPETRRSVSATVLRDQGSPIGENGSGRESGLPAAPSHGNAAVAKGCPPLRPGHQVRGCRSGGRCAQRRRPCIRHRDDGPMRRRLHGTRLFICVGHTMHETR